MQRRGTVVPAYPVVQFPHAKEGGDAIAGGFAQASRVGAEMARHGFELLTFPSDELFMGRGGAHCMTCPVLVA